MKSVLTILLFVAVSLPAVAQSRLAKSNLTLHDQENIGPFVVQRWAEASAVIPDAWIQNHIYEDLVVIYRGKPVLTLSTTDTADVERLRILEPAGRDIDGDGNPDLIVEAYSGGAHCCSTTTIYSVTDQAKPYWQQDTGNCSVAIEDLNHDGRFELTTCDDLFAYEFCPYAFSPKPPVVYRYDVERKTFIPDTPAFASHYSDRLKTHLSEAEKVAAAPTSDPDIFFECTVLTPAVETIYLTGKIEAGLELLHRLVKEDPDWRQTQARIVEQIKLSPHFAAR